MFLAMNRFYIARGKEDAFVEHWRTRTRNLDKVPGFRGGNLLRGESNEEHTLFVSHSGWESEVAFGDWTRSEAFRNAHATVGESPRDIFLGPPHLELFQSVL